MTRAAIGIENLRKPMTLRAIALYAFLAIALSWCIQLPAILLLGLDDSVTKAVFVLVMWSPTVLALAFMARSRAARENVRWRLGKLRYLPIGIGVETMIAFAMLGILMLAGLATSGWFTFAASGVSVAGGPWVLGTGFQHWPLWLLNIGATAITFSAVGLVATTGEEFAWRGFLQGHLEQHCSVVAAILWVALIWWAWHLPGLIAGYNFPETPLLGALVLFPLQMIGASLFFGWLTVRSGSFWPAALAHAAVNSIQQGVFDDLRLSGSALYAHLVRTVLIFAVGAICWWRLRSPGGSREVP
jgi:membrane protease YdiL (CAAX protease family)